MKQIYILMTCMFSIVLAACEPDKGTTTQDALVTGPTADGIAINNLDYGNSVIPFPNNLLFLDAVGAPPADGTLNIPLSGDASDGPLIALNELDGFSTVAPITTAFSGALDDASIPVGVKLYEVTTAISGAVISVDVALTFGVDFFATQSINTDGTSTLVLLPLKPLKPKQTYMPVITTALKSADGSSASKSSSYAVTQGLDPLHTGGVSNSLSLSDAQAQSLEPLRQATVAAETSLNTFDATLSSAIVLSWNFTTQSTSDVLAQVRTDVRALTASSGFSPSTAIDTPLLAATVRVGTLDVPYYLTVSTGVNDPTALGSSWEGAGGSNLTQFNTTAVATSTETIPMMVTIPKSVGACAGGMPGAGWPVVIYQHGITRKRGDVLAVADAMAGACMATVAIDLPMHGITGNETDGSAPFKDAVNGERTFDLDLVTQDASGSTIAAAPDTITDGSGTHFINLTNLLNSRDNVRQAVSDLFALVDAINEGAVTDGTNTMDPLNITFLGHSLGAIVGTPFIALETDVGASVLANGGASIAKILDGSTSFGATIAAGLAANGIVKGTSDFESFLGAAQTAVDSGDPVNYGTAAATGRGILFIEIVGDSVLGNPSDLTVPITVPDANDTTGTVAAPLAGAEPLIALLGLTTFNSDQAGANILAVTKFTSGYHGSLIDPSSDALASLAVTTEMQTQIATFLASGGTFLDITDDTLLQAP